jgi:BirA family biotin operon repressor/biotin-[acetyl-CoA-carboxylase] ligase
MDEAFWRVQVLGTTPSTQDMVRALAETGEPEGLAIQSLIQTSGRGRHGNEWSSPMGNLYMSLLLRPECKAGEAAQMAFVTALALSDAIDRVITDGPKKTLKWPNDVLIDGRKVSGILLETKIGAHGRIDYLIIGTGVNIFAPPPDAASLDTVKKDRIAVNIFRDIYLERLQDRYTGWRNKGFAPIREAWLKQAHGIDENMKIRLPEITYEGVFRGIDEHGALIAEVDGVRRAFSAGDVHFGVN